MTCVTCGATTASSRRTFARYAASSVGLDDQRRAYASHLGLSTVCLCDHCAQKRGAARQGDR